MKKIKRSALEVAFIIFLFYSNLLMGEFNRNGSGQIKGIIWALNDIFTLPNFTLALILAVLGQLIFDYLRDNRH